MSKHLNFLRCAAAALLLASPAFAETKVSPQTVVATVNGKEVTIGQMMVVRDNLPEQYRTLPDDVLFNGILDQIIQQSLLAQSLAGPKPERIAFALQNQERLMLADAAINAQLGKGPDEDALKEAYKEKYVDSFEGPKQFDASHILLETKEEAAALREEIVKGADFAEMAKQKSTGPSGPSGGSLGWFGVGDMVPPFEDAVTKMKIGEISEPVQTQFGWHLIRLNDTRTKEAPALKEVRGELLKELQAKMIDDYIEALKSKATIERPETGQFDPAILKQSKLLDVTQEGN